MARTIRFVLDSALLFWAAGKYCQCSFRSFGASVIQHIFTLGFLLGLALIAISLFFKHPSDRLGLGAEALGVCFLGAWIFVLVKQEKPRIGGA